STNFWLPKNISAARLIFPALALPGDHAAVRVRKLDCLRQLCPFLFYFIAARQILPNERCPSHMRLSLGKFVVHPQHGPAEVVERKTRKVKGEDVDYVVLEVEDQRLQIASPKTACLKFECVIWPAIPGCVSSCHCWPKPAINSN